MRPTRLTRPTSVRDALRGVPSGASSVGLQQSSVILGADHPLTRAIDAVQRTRRQLVPVFAVVVGSLIDLSEGAGWAGAVVLSAATVLFGLAIALAAFEQRKRDRALDVIAEGRESVPIAAVQRSRQRLSAPNTQRQIARTVEGMVEQSLHPPNPCSRNARPLFDVSVVSSVVEDLRTISEILRTEHASVRGVALAELLLGDGTSALYGDQPDLLREELGRVQRAMRE